MNKLFLSAILLFLVNCAFGQIKHTITRSTIIFQIKNLGINTHGSISGLQGNIQFDPANLAASSIEASVDVNTLNTDNDMRDGHLKEDNYFDVVRYPTITMKSVSIKQKSGNNYKGEFNLTLKGKTQLVEMPFTYTSAGNAASFKGTLKIKRTDFDIGGSSMILSDDVTVNIDVETSM